MNCVLGTAGHIDHGKSALVRALTGIETDRLPEEQRRGISIELGFAWLELGDGERAAIVDVPGHEKFVRHMLAGAHGFDVVLIVVAADDGVMPQTEEHFEIVQLLGVSSALFVITKADLVEESRILEVEEEIEILAAGTPLEASPVYAVSSTSGDGVEALRAQIVAALGAADRATEEGALRLPVDRVFRVKGHGLVATGTALAGSVRVGDDVEILPSGERARVREIQTHGVAAESAARGQRLALNLSGPGADFVLRGTTIVGTGAAKPATIADAQIELRPLAGRNLRSHSHVRLHLHTQEVRCRLVLMDGLKEIGPRDTAWAQLVAAEPFVASRGDRFVLRDETGAQTLGGGRIVLADVPRRRGAATAVGENLVALDDPRAERRVESLFELRREAFLARDDVLRELGLGSDAFAALLGSQGVLEAFSGEGGSELVARRPSVEGFLQSLASAIAAFHQQHPDRVGMELEALRSVLGTGFDPKVFRSLLGRLEADGQLQRKGNLVANPSHRPHLDPEDELLAGQVAELLASSGVTPPILADLASKLSLEPKVAEKLLGLLASRGAIVKVASDLYFDSQVLEGIQQQLVEHLEVSGEVTAGGFRDLISASRKYCIPLLDYLDGKGVTVRVGDVRKLRG